MIIIEDSHEALSAIKDLIIEQSSMQQISETIGVGRESLYKSLSKDGNPSFFTVIKIIHALGLKVTIG